MKGVKIMTLCYLLDQFKSDTEIYVSSGVYDSFIIGGTPSKILSLLNDDALNSSVLEITPGYDDVDDVIFFKIGI